MKAPSFEEARKIVGDMWREGVARASFIKEYENNTEDIKEEDYKEVKHE